MDRDKLVSILHQIKGIVDSALKAASAEESGRGKLTTPSIAVPSNEADLSFDSNVLAFMKKYAKGLSGDRKFTLLLAHITKGKTSQKVTLAELKGRWNKMKTVLGSQFNGAYANRAKANGWVDTPAQGTYTLCSSWKESLSG